MDEPATTAPTGTQHAFRTYASDLAKMAGGAGANNARPVPAPSPKPISAPAPKPASVHPAAVPEPPASIPPVPPKPPVPEASAPIQPPTGATSAPVPEPAAPAPTAPPIPQDAYAPPPATILPKAPSTDETREAVLARLKARVTPAPVAAPEPQPAYIIPKAPSTDERREEVLARLRAKGSESPVPGTLAPIPPKPPTPVPDPSPIHTYTSDFREKAKKEQASPITVLAAEQNAPRTPAPLPERSNGKEMLLIAGSIALVLAGSASVFFAYSFVTGKPVPLLAPLVPSLIFGDEHEELSGSESELRAGLAELGASLSEGKVVIAYVSVATTTVKGETITIPAEGGTLIAALGLPAPSIVLRNIEKESTVGALRKSGEAHPFFILRVASYERTFAGMLSWEPTIMRDLAPFYPEYPAVDIGTTTASSTPSTPKKPAFRDEVLQNHDVRVLRDGEGRSILLYGYRDKETLIITRDEASFSELLTRLAATRAR